MESFLFYSLKKTFSDVRDVFSEQILSFGGYNRWFFKDVGWFSLYPLRDIYRFRRNVLLYRQINSVSSLDALPPEAVLFFDGMCAVKNSTGNWFISGERVEVNSTILHSMASSFHVLSEYSFYPSEGYNSGRVNLKYVLQLIAHYEEIPWVVVFEWIRDFYGVSLETARGAVEALVKANRIEPAGTDTIRLKR